MINNDYSFFDRLSPEDSFLYVSGGEVKLWESHGFLGGIERFFRVILGQFNKDSVAQRIALIVTGNIERLSSKETINKLTILKNRFAKNNLSEVADKTLQNCIDKLSDQIRSPQQEADRIEATRAAAEKPVYQGLWDREKLTLQKQIGSSEEHLHMLEKKLTTYNTWSEKFSSEKEIISDWNKILRRWKNEELSIIINRNQNYWKNTLKPELEEKYQVDLLDPDKGICKEFPELELFAVHMRTEIKKQAIASNRKILMSASFENFFKMIMVETKYPGTQILDDWLDNSADRCISLAKQWVLERAMIILLKKFELKEGDIQTDDLIKQEQSFEELGCELNLAILDSLFIKYQTLIQGELRNRRRDFEINDCRNVFNKAIKQLAKEDSLNYVDVMRGQRSLVESYIHEQFLKTLHVAMPIPNVFKKLFFSSEG